MAMPIRIGLVYDLKDDYEKLGFSGETIAEFDSVETINALDETITKLGYEVDRIGNIWQLVERLAKGESWDIVFNIAEGLYGLARESQVPGLLDAYRIPYVFSSPDVNVICHNKAMAKDVVKAKGVPTARYHLVTCENDIANITLPYPLFAKPVAEGTGKGVSKESIVRNYEQLEYICKKLLKNFNQPVLVETYLSGREFTVGILGNGEDTKTVGAMEVILKEGAEEGGHTYHNKENYEELIEYQLAYDDEAKDAQNVAIAAWNALGCFDSGRIDIRCDENGKAHFIEVNPLAGLHPVRSDLIIMATQAGISYSELIGTIISSALKRNSEIINQNGAKIRVTL